MYSGEESFWVTIWALVAVALLGVVFIVSVYSHKEVEKYTSKGYCQVQKAGTTTHMWTKCKQQ